MTENKIDIPNPVNKPEPQPGRYRWALPVLAMLALGNIASAIAMACGSRSVYNVAMMRNVLLGRYTIGQTTMLTLLFIVTILTATVLLQKRGSVKIRAVQVTAMCISIVITLFLADCIMRVITPNNYKVEGRLMRRHPGYTRTGTVHDRPEAGYTFPNAQSGVEPYNFTFAADSRGYRNAEALQHCDILAIGDSFVEGSKCSDDQTWPLLLSELSGLKVYNAGCSGGEPDTYLATLQALGDELKPKIVLVMLYEGNDFRAPKNYDTPSLGYRVRLYRKNSPVLRLLRQTMTASLGPIGYKHNENISPDHRLWPVSWLPVEYPAQSGKFYAWDWKMSASHLKSRQEFQTSAGYSKTAKDLKRIQALCNDINAQLIVIFAPDKAHVVLPAANKDQLLDAEQIKAYFALKCGQNNIPGLSDLLENCNAMENSIAQWCNENQIDFFSLTPAFRQAITLEPQVYLTYDQHWTPDGYRIAATAIASYLAKAQNMISARSTTK